MVPPTELTSAPRPTAHTGSILSLRGVSKAFGPLVVLDDLSIDFARGTTTVVLGPSGAGKSVLLRIIVGLIRPEHGTVTFEGEPVTGVPEASLVPIRRRIGFLFQLSALFDSMTVRENLEFPLREHEKFTQPELDRKVAEALAMVDLKGVERRRPAELSGGQQKRVALARAIILRPDLILYDEPTTGLDPIRSAGINALIRKLQRELGITSIVVTHDLASAREVGDRVVMLRDGGIVADGTFDQLAHSRDPFVSAFLEGRDEPAADARASAAP